MKIVVTERSEEGAQLERGLLYLVLHAGVLGALKVAAFRAIWYFRVTVLLVFIQRCRPSRGRL